MKKPWTLVALLVALGAAQADELQLVDVFNPRGAFTPLYVRQPSGSYQAQQRGTLLGLPIELYGETRCVLVHPAQTASGPAYYQGRSTAVYMAQR